MIRTMYEVRWGEGPDEHTKPIKDLVEASDWKKKMDLGWPGRAHRICMIQVETPRPLEQMPLL